MRIIGSRAPIGHTVRRGAVRGIGLLALAMCAVSVKADAQQPSAAQQMLAPGQHEKKLETRTGMWRVTSTLRLTPDAKPIVQTAIATRTMVGPYLQEVMRPAANSESPDFRRISYLTYFRVEGRWHYVSLDTRFPVGIMPAYSFDSSATNRIELQFEPLAFVGLGNKVDGRMIRSNFIISWDGPNHDVAQQYWIAADGSGRKWLAVQYDYVRMMVRVHQ